MPKVSVNIPMFNSAKFIRETLEAALSQTYGDFEIIAYDDGSTDNTRDIINSIRDPRIKYIYKNNEGLSETRNKAILASSGEYIAFLDHDDLWLPEKLEKEVRFLEEKKEIALIFSDCFILKNGKQEKLTYFEKCPPKKGHIFEELLFESSNFIPLSTVVMRKDVFDKVGFFKKEFKIGEEYELFLRVARGYEFDYIDEPLAIYRVHESNYSKNTELFVKEVFDIMKLWENKEKELFVKNQNRFLKKEADLFAELANFQALNSRKIEALNTFSRSLSKYKNKNVAARKYILKFFGTLGYKISNKIVDSVRSV